MSFYDPAPGVVQYVAAPIYSYDSVRYDEVGGGSGRTKIPIATSLLSLVIFVLAIVSLATRFWWTSSYMNIGLFNAEFFGQTSTVCSDDTYNSASDCGYIRGIRGLLITSTVMAFFLIVKSLLVCCGKGSSRTVLSSCITSFLVCVFAAVSSGLAAKVNGDSDGFSLGYSFVLTAVVSGLAFLLFVLNTVMHCASRG